VSIIDDLHRTMRCAMPFSKIHELDQSKPIWVMTEPTWMQIVRELHDQGRMMSTVANDQRELFGIRVMITVSDPKDTPPFMLLMQPILYQSS